MSDPTPPPLDPGSDEARRLARRFADSCARYGVDRRRVLGWLAAGGAGGFLAACAGADTGPETPATSYVKDAQPFIRHGARNLETRLEEHDSFLTPTPRFFVRNNSATPRLDARAWRLALDGPGTESPLELSLSDLEELPQRSVFAYIECGGNQRAFFDLVLGRPATGTQWRTGGISMAEWTGVPLGELLRLAGLRDAAVDLQLIGLDTGSPEQGFRRPVPVAKALDPDTIVALRMNGEPLPPDHGYPARAIVPGWVGSANVKWLGRIEVATRKVWSRNNTTSYVLIGDDYPPEGEARGRVVNEQSIKSALALPWPARLSAGTRRLHGFAHSPHAPVERVEWSDDDGATWHAAELVPPVLAHAWVRFAFDWEAQSGEHAVITRATDAAGNTQPDDLPFNEKGYLFNLPLPHPVSVA